MTSKWLRSIGAAVLATALICSGQASAEAKKIKIGYDVVPIHLAPLIFNLGPDVAKNKGKTYQPDLIRFRGSAHQLAALAAGELDIAVLAFSTFAAGIVNAKQDIVAIADVAQDGPGFSSVYGVLETSPIKLVKDLKGKTLAINAAGGAVDMAARVVLEKNNLKPNRDVVILESGFGTMEAMLREGKTDVAVFLAPFWARASAKGGVRPLFHQRDGLGTTQFLLYAAKRDFVKNNRALLVDVMEDYIRGIRWLTNPANRNKALDMTAAWNKNNRDGYVGWAFLPDKDYRHDKNGKVNVNALQSNIDNLNKLGFLRQSIKVEDHLDHSIVEEAAKRIKN